MRILFAALLTLATSAGMAMAQDVRDTAIRDTIGNQIAAFEADDLNTAFAFASDQIRALFRNPANFGQMVRDGYPMVWRPGAVRYLGLRDENGQLWQRVMITDADGAVHMLDYQMLSVGDDWRINGVILLPGNGLGA